MATILQTLKLIKQWHFQRLNRVEKNFLNQMLDGLDGLGELNDIDVKDYLTERQEQFVRKIGAKFLISSKTKV